MSLSVLGSRKAAERLLSSHGSALELTESGTLFKGVRRSQNNIQFVSGHASRKRRFFVHTIDSTTSVADTELRVDEQLSKLGALHAHVGSIVFLYDDKSPNAFPFNDESNFLGFSGAALWNKITLVSLASGPSQVLQSWAEKGVRVFQGNESTTILPGILTLVDKSSNDRRRQIQHIYGDAAKIVRRNAEQAVILIAGHSGHGKSKTINRLIGQDLLDVGRATLGSTTKVIQRVEVRSTSKELATEITVAFDDSPGLEDNTFDDRELNASLLRAYKLKHFQDTFPTVILLVAAWDSITPDAHNKPSHFTSAIGKTIYALYCSNLVDDERSNIVVVVTKAMSSWHQFDDFKSQDRKSAQWRIEAGRRRGIVTDLQRKLFPRSSSWEVVFIENGGGTRDMTAKFPVLPDGVLSHQNLYDAMRNVIVRPSSDGTLDLVGIQALQVLTGATPLPSEARAKKTVVVSLSKDELKHLPAIMPPPLPRSERGVIHDLANVYLGTTYDNARGIFCGTSVLQSERMHYAQGIEITDFASMLDSKNAANTPERDGLRGHYSSDWAFHAAWTAHDNLECHILHCKTGCVGYQLPKLSSAMQELIARLPAHWSLEENSKYTRFFLNYGTHAITQLVLGGIIRVAVDPTTGGEPNIMVFRDGGASVAAEVTVCLEQEWHSNPGTASPRWIAARAKWIHALETEPVFCPDHSSTKFMPIYELAGLTTQQKEALKQGYMNYLITQRKADKLSEKKTSSNKHAVLQRQANLTEAIKSLMEAVTQALYRMLQGR
ncbi:protein hedgehog [Favolaschia claudopus]|uniref:Protein hedgehog n=1 Tax=Favolaschia claudopus TaxID=2862362 RepID=A0AAW0EI27_9AGAR